MKSIPLLLVAALALPATLTAQDVQDFVGQWESTTETPRGTFTTTYSFWMDGEVLKGSATGRMGETAIDEVTYSDGSISFHISREMQDRSMTITYTAKIVDGMLQGSMTTPMGEREFTATKVET